MIILRDALIYINRIYDNAETTDAGPIHDPWLSGLYRCVHSYGVGSKQFVAFLETFLLNYYFLFYFINKNNQCNYVNTNIISHTHTHMSEVEVYSVNKLTF